MAGYFHTPANLDAGLDFDEGTDLTFIADRTAVQVNESINLDIVSEHNIGRNPNEF
jgi:hypothetical protein